jgi:hypothetical protein
MTSFEKFILRLSECEHKYPRCNLPIERHPPIKYLDDPSIILGRYTILQYLSSTESPRSTLHQGVSHPLFPRNPVRYNCPNKFTAHSEIVLFILPIQLIHDRLTTATEWTLFQNFVLRCVRFAFGNLGATAGRVFFSENQAFPFARFRTHDKPKTWRTKVSILIFSRVDDGRLLLMGLKDIGFVIRR